MNSSFNRQFLLIDFRLLENPKFLKFIASSEFATYVILRRHIWRSTEPHYMGLNKLYQTERKLVCSLERKTIANILSVRENQVSEHLSNLKKKGVIKRIRTGRQSIFVLGEWIDVHRDGSYKGLEWFYLDGLFGISRKEAENSLNSDPGSADAWNSVHQTSAKTGDQTSALSPVQTSAKTGDNNIKENRDENTVNGFSKSPVIKLADLKQPVEKIEYLASEISHQLGDGKKSGRFYKLVAAKVPEPVIRQALAEIKADGADNPPKLFTYKINLYTVRQLQQSLAVNLR